MPGARRLSLELFGGVQLLGGDAGAAEHVLVQPKLVALLAYLAIPRAGKFRRRDSIVAVLWSELDQTHARGALRKAVHAIRTALGADVLPGRGDEELALSPDHISCDAAAFTEAVETAQLAEALELYRGELMPGFHLADCPEFERWLDGERAVAAERASAAAWALAQRYEGDSALSAAAQAARRAVRLAWGDERALRRALLMLERLHDRAGAVRLFDEFARRLKGDLDLEPSAETVGLIHRIRGSAAEAGS